MSTDEPIHPKRFDSIAVRANVALASGLALLAAAAAYGLVSGAGWMTALLERGWLVALLVIAVAGVAGVLLDLARSKNVAWRWLRQRFGAAFDERVERRNFGTGRAQIGDHGYFGVRCYGSPTGLEVGRIASLVNRPLCLPWSAMAKIDTFPNLLTGRKGFETDMQARITLREQPDLAVELPWLAEYRQLLPKSVKFRAIKLSKK